MHNYETIHLGYSGAGYDPSPAVMDAIVASLSEINAYPYEGYDELNSLIAQYCGVKAENVLVTNGGDEAIEIITNLYGKRVLIPTPTYGEYAYLARNRGSMIRYRDSISDDNYKISFAKDDLEWATLGWICNPNNPTGTVIPRETIIEVLKGTGATIVVDEAYYEFSGESVADLIEEYSNLIVLRTFSKGFGIAGLRLGYVLAKHETIERMKNAKQEFNVNRVARAAGIAALKDLDYYLEKIGNAKRIRDSFERSCMENGIKVMKSHGGFVFLKFRSMDEMSFVHSRLEENGIVTFNSSDAEFSKLNGPYIRIAVGSEKDMESAKAALAKVLSEARPGSNGHKGRFSRPRASASPALSQCVSEQVNADG